MAAAEPTNTGASQRHGPGAWSFLKRGVAAAPEFRRRVRRSSGAPCGSTLMASGAPAGARRFGSALVSRRDMRSPGGLSLGNAEHADKLLHCTILRLNINVSTTTAVQKAGAAGGTGANERLTSL